jgi:hypothetical protein
MFYIVFAGVYWVYTSLRQHKIDWRLFGAISLLGIVFLLTKYRLVYAMFIDPAFVSHRIEFDIFFQENLWESYRLSLVKFLEGHAPHSQSLQMFFIIPISLYALVISFSSHRFTPKESILLWTLLGASLYFDLWQILLIHRFTLPAIFIIALLHIFIKHKYHLLSKMLIFVITLSIFASIFEYNGFHILAEKFNFFRSFNMTRIYFLAPIVWLIIFVYSIRILYQKLSYTPLVLIILISMQSIINHKNSFYKTQPQDGYASFDTYYIPDIYKQIKQTIYNQTKDNHTIRVAHYGIEPAVSLYNGLYTIDGYSTNYPLSYKHKFRQTFSDYKQLDIYDKWGSKVYIGSITNRYDDFLMIKGLHIQKLQFDSKVLCELNTDYLITPYHLEHPQTKNLSFIKHYQNSNPKAWEIYLYRLDCDDIQSSD